MSRALAAGTGQSTTLNFQIPKALYPKNIVPKLVVGVTREGYIGSDCHASALRTQRWAGKFAM